MSQTLCLIISSLLGLSLAFGQIPDSIQSDLKGMTKDSSYVDELNKNGTIYLRSNPNITRILAGEAIDLAPRIQYPRGYARALTLMGNSYWYEGIYEFAQNYYLLAARQYQTINDSIGLGQTYNNIGEVYKKLKDYPKALSYLMRAKELKKGDSTTHALTLYNIGELYIFMNDLKEGKKYIDRSLKIAQAENNQRVIAYDYWCLGTIERKNGDHQAALQYYFESENIWAALGELRSLIQTYQDIAEIYLELKNYDDAEKYLTKAIAMSGTIRVPDLQVNNFLRFARLDSLRGNFKRSLQYLYKHNVLKDSVYNLLKAEQIARLQTIYETEAREKENQMLRSEKQFKDTQLVAQQITLVAITVGLVLLGILAWFLSQQRKKIFLQKEAIEMQAVALLKLNEELQELNKNLENRIDERTSQLTLQNQRLTEYTFINAHKLRAPVASILGLINLLEQVSDSKEEKAEILDHLKTCGEHLDAIIREVSRNLESAIVNDK